jgi:hypothetical protein
MTMFRQFAWAAVLVVLPTLAVAQSGNDAIKKFGLPGAWAVDCKQPPSSSNPYMLFGISKDGKATRVYQSDGGKNDGVFPVSNARLRPDGRLEAVMQDATGNPASVVLSTEGRKLYTVTSTKGGRVLIENGRFTNGNRDVARLDRCR